MNLHIGIPEDIEAMSQLMGNGDFVLHSRSVPLQVHKRILHFYRRRSADFNGGSEGSWQVEECKR